MLKMKIFEILNFNREPLKRLQQAGIRIDDVEYIDLYNDYRTMLDGGDKVSYIVATLADRYHVSERKVYTLIKRYGSECNAQLFGGVKRKAFENVLQKACSVICPWCCSLMEKRGNFAVPKREHDEQILFIIGEGACRWQDPTEQKGQDKILAQ